MHLQLGPKSLKAKGVFKTQKHGEGAQRREAEMGVTCPRHVTSTTRKAVEQL